MAQTHWFYWVCSRLITVKKISKILMGEMQHQVHTLDSDEKEFWDNNRVSLYQMLEPRHEVF